MNLRAFVILVTVELRRFFRVPATWFWTLAFPFMLFALFMGIFGGTQSLPLVSITLVDEDRSAASAAYVNFLTAGYEQTKAFRPVIKRTLSEADAYDMAKGRGILLVIPKRFAEQLAASQSVILRLRQLDGDYRSSTALGVTASINETYNIESTGLTRKVVTRVEKNPDDRNDRPTPFYFATGILVMSMFSTCLFGSGIALAQMKEEGVFRFAALMPLNPLVNYLAFAVSRMLALLCVAVVFMGGVSLVYPLGIVLDAPLAARAVLLVVVGCATFMAISVALTTASKSSGGSLGLSNAIYYPTIFLSNLFVPYSSMPAWATYLGDFLPVKHLTEAFRRVLSHDAQSSLSMTLGYLLIWLVASLGIVLFSARRRAT